MRVRVRDSFQGMCIQDLDGSETILEYDQLPSEVRGLLQNAKFNICPICAGALVWRKAKGAFPKFTDWVEVINEVEDELVNS